MEAGTKVVLVDVLGASSVRGTFVGRASKGFFGAFRVSHLMTLCCYTILREIKDCVSFDDHSS